LRRLITSAFLALTLSLSFSSIPAAAATGGTITGTLKDANGNPVAGVCVWLGPVHLATNCTLTDANGQYTISGLPLGLSWPITYHKPPIFNDLDMGNIPVLTATPVNNSLWDLYYLLAYFLMIAPTVWVEPASTAKMPCRFAL